MLANNKNRFNAKHMLWQSLCVPCVTRGQQEMAQPVSAGPARGGTACFGGASKRWHSLLRRGRKSLQKRWHSLLRRGHRRLHSLLRQGQHETAQTALAVATRQYCPTGLQYSVFHSAFGLFAGSSARAALSLKWAFPHPRHGQTASRC